MAEFLADKQFDPTPHRRDRAREQGQVARSHDLAASILLVGALALLLYWGEGVASFLAELMRHYLGGEAWVESDSSFVVHQYFSILVGLGRNLLPLLVAMFIIAVAANIGQLGLLWLPEKLAFDLDRINPVTGAQRLFSVANLLRLVFAIGKVTLVVAMAAWIVWGQLPSLVASTILDVPQIAALVSTSTLQTALKVAAALLILALLDYFQAWRRHEQDLRMSHQELKEELKEMQGDPQMIQRRKAVQRQLVLNRLRTSVPKADVVVTNPTELAIAIRYEIETMVAPIVVAKGAGVLAQRIRRLALENDVPIVERKELARALYKEVEVGQAIPTQQYAAVAEVLRYVYQLKGKTISPEVAKRAAA